MRPRGITDETWQRLTSKAKLYVAEYVQHGNTLKAYRNAGYTRGKKDADIERHKAAAYQIRKGKWVRQALVEHADHRADLAQAKKDYALDWIVFEHERLMKAAEVKGDLAVATRNLELIGRTRGVYADSVRIDVAARREYSEAEEVEMLRLSKLLLLEDASSEELTAVKEAQRKGTSPPATPSPPSPQTTAGEAPSQEKSGEIFLTPAGPAEYSGPDTIAKPEPEGDEEPAVVVAVI